jgi:DNA-binding IclR family transcriptional regulator
MTDDSRESAPPSVESSSSVGKALHILSLFGPERPEWGASEVARELSVTVPTAHRLLNVLTHHGFLARFGRGRFRLGLEAISLGRRALASIDLRSVLHSDLR